MNRLNKNLAEEAKENAGMSSAELDNVNVSDEVTDAVPSIGVQLLCRDKFMQGYKLMNLQCKRSYLESLISKNNAVVELRSNMIRENREFIIDRLSQVGNNGTVILDAACNLLSMQPAVAKHLEKQPDTSLGFSFKIHGNSEEQTEVLGLEFAEWVHLTQIIS